MKPTQTQRLLGISSTIEDQKTNSSNVRTKVIVKKHNLLYRQGTISYTQCQRQKAGYLYSNCL